MKRPLYLILSALSLSLLHAGSNVDYTVGEEVYEGYYTAPEGNKAPLVLILHDWDGLTEYEVQRAEMLVKKGYAVFAADLFGKGIRPTEVKDKRQHTGELYQNREKMRQLIRGAQQKAGELGADTSNTVIMGYCFGGAAVLEAARANIPAKAYATFHGGLGTPEGQSYEDTKGEILVYHGTADTLITLDDFAALGKDLETAGVPHELITYGGAPHSFTVFTSGGYQKAADVKSWAHFTGSLDRVLPVKITQE